MNTSEEALRNELFALREELNVRRKYGQSLTDKQVADIIKQEKITAEKQERKRQDAERAQIEQRKREQEIREKGRDLVSTGRILINVRGVPVPTVNENLCAPCPACGAPLVDSAEPVYSFSHMWLTTPADQRFGSFSPLIRQEGIGTLRPTPFYINSLRCRSCGEQSLVCVQLVVL